MILDKDLLLMDSASVAHAQGEVAFTNVIDLGVAHRGSGKPLKLFGQFDEALDSDGNNTTIVIAIAVGTTVDLGTALLTTGKPLVGPHFVPWFKVLWEIADQCPQSDLRK